MIGAAGGGRPRRRGGPAGAEARRGAGAPRRRRATTTPAGTGSASQAQTAIDAAKDYLGTPYAWGGGGTRGPGPGLDPDEGVIGFDCSGLTQYAYAQAGISIPRNSRAQYASLPKVSSDDLRPGDLVFWGTDRVEPGHASSTSRSTWAANQVVQAPQSGDVVKVSSMWWGGYVGAVRPAPERRRATERKGVGQPRGELPDATIRLAAGTPSGQGCGRAFTATPDDARRVRSARASRQERVGHWPRGGPAAPSTAPPRAAVDRHDQGAP